MIQAITHLYLILFLTYYIITNVSCVVCALLTNYLHNCDFSNKLQSIIPICLMIQLVMGDILSQIFTYTILETIHQV